MKNVIIGIFLVAIMLLSSLSVVSGYNAKIEWSTYPTADKPTYGRYENLTFHYAIKNTGSSRTQYVVDARLYDTYDGKLVDSWTLEGIIYTLNPGESKTWNLQWNIPIRGWKEHEYRAELVIHYMGGKLTYNNLRFRVVY